MNPVPVYDESTILLEEKRREERKENTVEYGNTNELIEQEQGKRIIGSGSI